MTINPDPRPLRLKVLFAALALAALSCLAPPFALGGERATVRVERVLDGDTVDVRVGPERRRVRLLGVDAPEVAHGDKPGEPYGRSATRFVRETLAAARGVELEVAGDRLDIHGRTLGFLWVRIPGRTEPLNLSEELLRQGIARAVRHFEYPGKGQFLALEAEARRARRGMWRK